MRHLSCLIALGLAACAPAPAPIEHVSEANFINGGFDTGSFGASWQKQQALWGNGSNNPGFAHFPPTLLTDLNYTLNAAGSVDNTVIVGSGVPTELQAADSLRTPFFGPDAAKVNGPIGTQGSHNVNILSQQMTVNVGDIDASDGLVHIRFAAAPVLNYLSTHPPTVQPYFFITIDNTTKGVNLYNTYNFTNQPGVQWKTSSGSINADPTLYTDWNAFDIAPGPSAIAVGDLITATLVASACAQNGHFGELYVDEFGTTLAYPNVNVSAPAFVNQSSTLKYTVTVKNNSASSATGVVVDFKTPVLTESSTAAAPQSVNTTWNATNAAGGVTCTNPAPSTAGTVVCNVGTLAAGASYTFTVTVNVPAIPAGYATPVFVNEGTYDVKTDQHPTPIGGGLVQTTVTTSNIVGLQTTVTDGKVSALWNSTNAYTVTITNNGPATALLTHVSDTRPATLQSPSWACTVVAGSPAGTDCGTTTSGSGAISANVNLQVGGSVTFAVTGTKFVGGPAEASVTYTVTAAPPSMTVQSVTFNNIGTDTDTVSSALDVLTVGATAGGTGSGTIVSQPTGINCASCSASFADGSSVALTAEPAAGSVFTGWTGGGCAAANPCVVTLAGATTVTARFDKPALTTALSATSNANSQNVRPGDTADYTVQVAIPKGASGAPIKVTDTFPTGLAYVSSTTPVITATGGSLTCTAGACTAPSLVTGAITTWDFGAVTCATTAASCLIDFTVHAQVAATSARGDTLINNVGVTLLTSINDATLTVIEPNLAISRTASPNTGLNRGDVTTVTVTLTNTGVANSSAFDMKVTLPIPANFTGATYAAGTCPAGATATFTGGNTIVTFPTGAGGALASGASCSFTYKLTVGAAATGNATISLAAGTATSKSITGAAPPAKAYSAVAAAITVQTAAIANGGGCTAAAECVSVVCDTDSKCGYKDGDGPCTPSTTSTVCRSTFCSQNDLCEPNGQCFVDNDCNTLSQFCNTQTHACVPKIPNGTNVPTITGHTPPLTGACNLSVGTAVCSSGVCDTDGKCGYKDGDGLCTPSTTSTVCRSTFCSQNDLCEPLGECFVDGDCNTATQFCNTQTHACAPRLPNGTPIPTIGGHTPTLDGTCSVSVSAAVCTSLVCDATDAACGYKNGDGSCDATTAPVVCRSGVCGSDGKCGYVDGTGPCDGASAATVCRSASCTTTGLCGTGCFVDTDCDTATQFCDTPDHLCTPKLPNGSPLPTVTGHAPPLDGVCTLTAAAVVCVSAVCDGVDNECGYLNGDGPCTTATAATVCRSSVCGPDGNCGLPDGTGPCDDGSAATVCRSHTCSSAGLCGVGCSLDSECAANQYCDTAAHLCAPKIANGGGIPSVSGHVPDLTGSCTADAAAAACVSGVCDGVDNLCGYADGDGSCSPANAATVCRSGACRNDGKCGAGDAFSITGGGLSCAMGGRATAPTAAWAWLLAMAIFIRRRRRAAG